MQGVQLILKKENSLDIWKNRHLFQLQNFNAMTLIRIYLELHPRSHFKERKKYYFKFIKDFQRYKISEINTTLLRYWFSQIQNENALVEKTLHRIKCQLNHFFKWLKEENILTLNPLDNIRFRQNIESARSRVLLSTHELQTICTNAKEFSPSKIYPVLYTLIHTGARRSEVINLQWKDIDFENNMIIFLKTKNGECRKINMSSYLRSLFENLPKNRSFIFFNSKGTRASGHSISRAIQQFKKVYPINKDWQMHDLRHSFAYNFLMNKGEMYQLQAILGHKSIKMTVDLYGNLKAQDIKNPSPYEF